MSASVDLQPLPATTLTFFHHDLTGNMRPQVDEQYDPNVQLAGHFHAKQTLTDDHLLENFPNVILAENFSQFIETPDDATRHISCSISDEVLLGNPAMLQRNNMQQYYHQISGNPSSIPQN